MTLISFEKILTLEKFGKKFIYNSKKIFLTSYNVVIFAVIGEFFFRISRFLRAEIFSKDVKLFSKDVKTMKNSLFKRCQEKIQKMSENF